MEVSRYLDAGGDEVADVGQGEWRRSNDGARVERELGKIITVRDGKAHPSLDVRQPGRSPRAAGLEERRCLKKKGA